MNYRKNLNPLLALVHMVCYWYVIYLFILDILGFKIYIWGRFHANYSLPYVKTPIGFWYKRVSNLSPIFKEKKKT